MKKMKVFLYRMKKGKEVQFLNAMEYSMFFAPKYF